MNQRGKERKYQNKKSFSMGLCAKGSGLLKVITVCLIFLIFAQQSTTFVHAAQDEKINVYLDRFPLAFEVEPRIVTNNGGHTVVPFRKLAESLGVKVTWEQATQTIKAEGYDQEVYLTINQATAQVNGAPYTLGTAPFVDGGHTLIPLRFFSEVFGAQVKWDQAQQTIHITSPKRELYTFAFYGLGSFAQRHYIPAFDGIGYTWSRINQQGEWTISSANQNEYFWPEPHPDASPEDLIASGQVLGGEAHLMVAAFEARGEVSALLLDQEKKDTALQQMVNQAFEKKMNGILIDFEGIENTEEHQQLKYAFTAFIKELKEQAKQKGLKVAIALPPPNNHYNGYEYEKLGELADFIFLMAYDYNPRGTGMTHQLPEPMLLVNQGIEQSLAFIPAEKLVLGINVVYETEVTLEEKIGLAKRHHLKGVGLWILKGLKPAQFERLNASILP